MTRITRTLQALLTTDPTTARPLSRARLGPVARFLLLRTGCFTG